MIQEELLRQPKNMEEALSLIDELRHEVDRRPIGIVIARKILGEAIRLTPTQVARMPLSPEYFEVEIQISEREYLKLTSCIVTETPDCIGQYLAVQKFDGTLRWVLLETEQKS